MRHQSYGFRDRIALLKNSACTLLFVLDGATKSEKYRVHFTFRLFPYPSLSAPISGLSDFSESRIPGSKARE